MGSAEARVEQERARAWWEGVPADLRWELGDVLVWGSFHWSEWGFEGKPSGAFMREVDRLRILWETVQ